MRNVHEIAQGLRARKEGKLAAELADNSLRAESRFNAIYQELGVAEIVTEVTDDFRRNTTPFEHHSSRSIISANPPYFHKETFFWYESASEIKGLQMLISRDASVQVQMGYHFQYPGIGLPMWIDAQLYQNRNLGVNVPDVGSVGSNTVDYQSLSLLEKVFFARDNAHGVFSATDIAEAYN